MPRLVGRLWVTLALCHVLFFALWAGGAVRDGVPHDDWWAFRLAAERAWSGQWDLVYPLDFSQVPRDRFLYPPYALVLYLPTAFLPDTLAFLAIDAIQLLALGIATTLLIRELRPPEDVRDALLASLIGSAALTWELILGQNGGLFLLAYVLAVVAWRRRAPGWMGIGLGILGIKPHWTLAPAICLGLSSRRALLGFAAVGIALVGVSLPLGIERWHEFWVVSTNQVDLVSTRLEGRHNLTIRGLVLALTGSATAVSLAWGLLLIPSGLALWAVWRAAVDPVRKISALVLFTLSMNLYTNVYDGLVMLLPAMDWLCGPDRLGERVVQIGVAAMMIAWLWDARTWLWPVALPQILEPGPFSLVGLVALSMLLALGWAAHRASAVA